MISRTHANLSFQRARPDQIPAAQEAYREIIEHLARTVDYPHWHSENHPTPDEVQEWVEAGELYLALAPTDAAGGSAEIVGVVVLNQEGVEAYRDAAWAVDAAPEEVLVIHALGVVPRFLRQGIAQFMVEASLQTARDRACRTVRLDTYVENLPARELYARYGFTDLGVHTVRYEGTDLTQFHLFEYVL